MLRWKLLCWIFFWLGVLGGTTVEEYNLAGKAWGPWVPGVVLLLTMIFMIGAAWEQSQRRE